MKMQFRVLAKSGSKTLLEIVGREGVEAKNLTVGEMAEGVHEAEALLEKLTGYRWHIEQVS